MLKEPSGTLRRTGSPDIADIAVGILINVNDLITDDLQPGTYENSLQVLVYKEGDPGVN